MKRTLLAIGVLTVFTANAVLASEQITACANKKSGNMRVVDNANMCDAKEYALTWNIAGIQGPAGEQGITGDIGPKGDTGAQGSKGKQGMAGANGQQGPQGEQGEQGEQGIAGMDGLPSVYDGDGNLLGSLLGEYHDSTATVNNT
jgi:hypothetical protein